MTRRKQHFSQYEQEVLREFSADLTASVLNAPEGTVDQWSPFARDNGKLIAKLLVRLVSGAVPDSWTPQTSIAYARAKIAMKVLASHPHWTDSEAARHAIAAEPFQREVEPILCELNMPNAPKKLSPERMQWLKKKAAEYYQALAYEIPEAAKLVDTRSVLRVTEIMKELHAAGYQPPKHRQP